MNIHTYKYIHMVIHTEFPSGVSTCRIKLYSDELHFIGYSEYIYIYIYIYITYIYIYIHIHNHIHTEF